MPSQCDPLDKPDPARIAPAARNSPHVQLKRDPGNISVNRKGVTLIIPLDYIT